MSPTIVVYLRVYSSMQLLIVSVRSMVNYLRSPLASVIQVLNMRNGHGGAGGFNLSEDIPLLTMVALNSGCMKM